jgi:hypothetical protein
VDSFTGLVVSAPHTKTLDGDKKTRFQFATKAGEEITMYSVTMPEGYYRDQAKRAAQRGSFVQVVGTLTSTTEGARVIEAAIVAAPDTHTSEPIVQYDDPSGHYLINRSRDSATGRDALETMIFHGTFLAEAFSQDLTRAPEFDGDMDDEYKISDRFHSCIDRDLAWIDGEAFITGCPDQF